MAGIILRIKAFLYFGTLFLFMAMLSMVAHAQQALGHVWPWWAFGIGTGIAILVMFGMIEKRKNDLDSLKRNPEDSDS
jgi:EamA domain-containing membrane protein RarD